VDESVLKSDTFWELNSDPDFLRSRSVDIDVDVDEVDRAEQIWLQVFGSSFFSLLEKWKHFIVPKGPTA
jgi:hypothetical protein